MAVQFAHDVFLSYHPQDRGRVRRLAGRLRDAGLRVWFDAWVVELGQDRDEATEGGLAAARTLVLCLPPALLAEDWLARKRSTVPFRDPAEGRRFLPLLLETCDLPEALRGYKLVDYRAEGEAAFDELLATRQAETLAPPPPGEALLAFLERVLGRDTRTGCRAWRWAPTGRGPSRVRGMKRSRFGTWRRASAGLR